MYQLCHYFFLSGESLYNVGDTNTWEVWDQKSKSSVNNNHVIHLWRVKNAGLQCACSETVMGVDRRMLTLDPEWT